MSFTSLAPQKKTFSVYSYRITHSSSYIILEQVLLFNFEIYLQNFNCSLSSILHDSNPHNSQRNKMNGLITLSNKCGCKSIGICKLRYLPCAVRKSSLLNLYHINSLWTWRNVIILGFITFTFTTVLHSLLYNIIVTLHNIEVSHRI